MNWLTPRGLRLTWMRYGASLVAFLVFVSQLGSVAHLAFVQHVECADHGEMVEVSGQGIDHVDQAAAVHQDATQTHGHDHCTIATFRRDRSQTRTMPVTTAPLSKTDLGSSLVRAIAPPPSICILDLAPKISPPAALS